MAGRTARRQKSKVTPRQEAVHDAARPRPPARPGRRPLKRWKPVHTGVAGGIAVAVLALLFLLARSAQNPTSPVAAGDFTLVAYQGQDVLGGDRVQFSQVLGHGKPVVLNFFAGACAPCRVEMPAFQKVADKYEGRVIFIGIDVGPFTGLGTHDDAARLLKDLGIRYPAGYAVDETPLALYVQGMPTTVVFDARGQVVTKVTGTMTEAQLVTALQSTLGS